LHPCPPPLLIPKVDASVNEIPDIPSYETVIGAIETEYDLATTSQVSAMTFFLNTVTPCVDPEVSQKRGWLEGSTHLQEFGDFWHAEMATSLLLLKEYSNPENLIHNATTCSLGDHVKKKRKRLHSKMTRGEHFNYYYRLCKKMLGIRKEVGFQPRMERWDKECCKQGDDRRKRGPADRINIVPQCTQYGEEDDNLFDEYLAENDLFHSYFDGISNLTPESPVPTLTVGNEAPMTQQPV
jgi:hypothetical protein